MLRCGGPSVSDSFNVKRNMLESDHYVGNKSLTAVYERRTDIVCLHTGGLNMFFQILRSAFSAPKKPVDLEIRQSTAIRRIVAQHSHGNVRLQKGIFYTKNSIDEQYENIKDKNFCDS